MLGFVNPRQPKYSRKTPLSTPIACTPQPNAFPIQSLLAGLWVRFFGIERADCHENILGT